MIRFLCFAVTFILTIESAQSNDTIFTKAQANSIKERIEKVKEGGIRYICRLNGRRYYFYSSSDDDTANSISKKFNIPIDTLLILSEAGRMDYDIEMNMDKDRASFWKRVQNTFFTNPNTTMGELGEKNKCGNLSFYFACDPTIIVKKERDFNESIFAPTISAKKERDFNKGIFKYCILSDIDRTVEVVCFSNSDSVMSKIRIPDHVIYKGITYTVLAIGKGAFLNCEQIESVSISNGVIEIGDEAFRGCKGIKSANIPSSVTYIGKFAFQNCNNITTLALKGLNVYIGEKAFDNCTSLNELIIPDKSPIKTSSNPHFFFSECGSNSKNTTITVCQTVSDMPHTRNGEHQFYKGNFKMKGFGYGFGTSETDGVATYRYRTASDGVRLFEGDFSFEGHAGYKNLIHYQAKGRFKNNIQVGQWTWRITGNDENNSFCEINFDENGVPDGNFFMWIGKSETINRRSWMRGLFREGKLEYINYRDRGNIETSGKYNRQGRPIGKWVLSGSEVRNRTCYFVFDTNGDCKESYYIDETTGDKINVYSRIPYEIFEEVISSVRSRCFRSTPRP